MRVIVDFSINPVGVPEITLSEYLAECVRILESKKIRVKSHACGLNIEGDYEAIFKKLHKCQQAAHELGSEQVVSTIKVLSRTDIDGTIEDEIKALKKQLKSSKRLTKGRYTPEPTQSPYCKVKRSSIHNLGVTATQFIPEGTEIIEYVGDKVTKSRADEIYQEALEAHQKDKSQGAVYLFVLNNKYDINGDVDWNTAKYINHSCDPNCETDVVKGRIWITAIRDIQKGEELSYDYGYDLDSWEDHPCYCGTDKCLGYIVDEMERPKLKKILMKKNLLKKNLKKKNQRPLMNDFDTDKSVQTQNFHFETSKRQAIEKSTGKTGQLISATQIFIKGDHTEGPVMVEVCYIVRFLYDQEFVDQNGKTIDQIEHTFDRVVPRDDWRKEYFEVVKKRKWWLFS